MQLRLSFRIAGQAGSGPSAKTLGTASTEGRPMAQDTLIQVLERRDAERRPERAARIEWVAQHNLDVGLVMGSVEALNLLREARECFVEGHYIATLVLATAFIEHVIAEQLVASSKAKFGIEFRDAIALARKEQLFPEPLLDSAEQLRVLRNPFAHRKPDGHEHTLGNRYLAQKRHPQAVAEEDARTALIAMYGHFHHPLKRGA
jgi:hypothetical protein